VKDSMTLKILLPYEIFYESDAVKRMVIETQNGSFGILPNRLDCVAALVPGILTYETQDIDEIYVAIDEGIFVKSGNDVLVSVRSAFSGANLGDLQALVEKEFLNLDEREKSVRLVITKLESEFVHRYVGSRHE
jgi:F-type H+-transporting ATPase subunit epsilon